LAQKLAILAQESPNLAEDSAPLVEFLVSSVAMKFFAHPRFALSDKSG
jgi:hypothetical protein